MSWVVDSSFWIEWLSAKKPWPLGIQTLPVRTEIIVPTIVQFEVIKWLRREASEGHADSFLSFSMLCDVVPLDTSLAVYAAEVSQLHKLAMADAIVYATALQKNSTLLTFDAHFRGLDSVKVLDKILVSRT